MRFKLELMLARRNRAHHLDPRLLGFRPTEWNRRDFIFIYLLGKRNISSWYSPHPFRVRWRRPPFVDAVAPSESAQTGIPAIRLTTWLSTKWPEQSLEPMWKRAFSMLAHGARMPLADDILRAWRRVQAWNQSIGKSFWICRTVRGDWRTYRSKNCTPLIEATPMYKNTPNNTDIGIKRSRGAAVTDKPTSRDTQNPETRCSLTSVICGLSPGAWVLFVNEDNW